MIVTPSCKQILAIPFLCFLLGACAPTPEHTDLEPPIGHPATFPVAFYRDAANRGETVYRVIPEASQIVIHVYRGGRLARLGHNHTVTSRDVRGYALDAEPTNATRFDLYFPAQSLIVDDTADRDAAGEGFETRPSVKAIEGTRGNLLGERVLDAVHHPFVEVSGRMVGGEPGSPELELEIRIRGSSVTRRTRPTVAQGNARLVIDGELYVLQSAFGIEPYSVLGGALKVEDRLRVTYRLVVERVAP
jgi:hypothetical protein